MGLLDRLRRAPSIPDDAITPMPGFRIEYGDETRFIADAASLDLMREGRAQPRAQEQYYLLDMLTEEGRATPTDDGFSVPAHEVARFSDTDGDLFGMPRRFTGELVTAVHRWTASRDFNVVVEVVVDGHPTTPRRRGPVMRAGERNHRLSAPLLEVMRATEAHATLADSERTEAQNVRLVARLQQARQDARQAAEEEARDEHLTFSLHALDRFATVAPERVGLTVQPQADGSLLVEPDLGTDVDRELVSRRWRQLDVPRPNGDPAPRGGRDSEAPAVLRVDDTLVLLESHERAAVEEVRRTPRIPADQVESFLRAPGSFYDPDLVDVDVTFGVRVAGIGVVAPLSFAEASASGLQWFSETSQVSPPEALAHSARTRPEQATVEEKVNQAWERGESVVAVDEKVVDVTDRSRVEQAFAASRQRITKLEERESAKAEEPEDPALGRQVRVGMHIHDATDTAAQLRQLAATARPARAPELHGLRRRPLAHQVSGIAWLTGLMHSALNADEDAVRIQGALLADDMGLGKTFMTLAALGEAVRYERDSGRALLPTLAVMPVALLENWLEEIDKTFGSPAGPFDDVVVLQGKGLAEFRVGGSGRETAASVDDLDERGMVREDRLRTSLHVGPGAGERRLDQPGRLVLTTYEALRRFQLSLGSVDWGVVVMDEAQATKNPETLAARAAKGLKARFKLLATGTPVENSLRDFWSLVDTAQPGLLGSWAQFRQTWVEPMAEADGAEQERLGVALREAVGEFMLRRVKEDQLHDLPRMHIREYPRPMPPVQRDRYEQVLEDHRGRAGAKGAALATLHALSAVSLHPSLLSSSAVDVDPSTADDSARTLVAVRDILGQVRAADEKAIVFAKTKEMQRVLAVWLSTLYGVRVDVVNGDTAATGAGSETRLARIRAFERKAGFNVIIMSPLAVGVGLTVVGANHAIHLERHWNPAKEAQATDRIHRIGQEREVYVHYPIAIHPDLDSFDVNLDRLLRSKVALKDAVVVPGEVSGTELEKALSL